MGASLDPTVPDNRSNLGNRHGWRPVNGAAGLKPEANPQDRSSSSKKTAEIRFILHSLRRSLLLRKFVKLN
jgi:hypothetical protein